MSITVEILAVVLSSLFMLAALGFTLVPIVPGALFVIPGILLYGWMENFHSFSKMFWTGQLIITVIIFLTDNIAQAFGMKKMGGSRSGIWGATIGMFVIPLLISPLGPIAVFFGPLLGAVVGAMVGELFMRRSSKEILRVGFGAALSFLGGTFFKFLLVAAQVIWFYTRIF